MRQSKTENKTSKAIFTPEEFRLYGIIHHDTPIDGDFLTDTNDLDFVGLWSRSWELTASTLRSLKDEVTGYSRVYIVIADYRKAKVELEIDTGILVEIDGFEPHFAKIMTVVQFVEYSKARAPTNHWEQLSKIIA